MDYIIPVLTSVVSAMLVFLLQAAIKENRQLKHEKDVQQIERETALAARETALENGVVCLLRVKLIEYHAKYMKLGYISSHALENWLLMYKAYKALGGNGMIDHMKQEIEELHIEEH